MADHVRHPEGVLREMYFSMVEGQITVVFMFEAAASEVELLLQAFPFVRSGLLRVEMLRPLTPFGGLAALFDPKHMQD